MPGNEVGDRVHNFFDQGNLSQDQRHTQLVAGNWPAYNNNIWSANERHTGGPVNSGSENYNAQQSDIERGQGNQILLGPQGLNFTRSGLRPDFAKSPQQLQQLNLNGFMHASQVGHTRQNEANFLGMDTEPDRHNMTSRGLSLVESQQRSGSQQTNSASFGGSDSPMNFTFLGGQQQMNGQQPGMLQSFSRQQPGSNDAQFQQQIMLKQMQELQRQQQFQQLEAMQRSSTSHMPSFHNQSAGQHLPTINGNPMHDSSNFPWSSQMMAANANWQQRGVPSSVQGYSNGFMVTPEQGQHMFSMGLIPQQASQSLYGVPVPGSRNTNAFSHSNIDKPGQGQGQGQSPGPGPGPGPNNSFPGNQYGAVAGQLSMQDGTVGSRSKSEGKSSLEQVSNQHIGNVVNMGGFSLMQQRNVPISEGGGQGFAGGSEFVTEKSVTQASPQGGSTQSSVALDPTEEKILFGSDDNIWEAFGGPSLSGSGDATDLLNGLPSMQSGTWSALMQSAVAETSSTDVGIQEEWSGLDSQNSQSQPGNQHPSVIHGNEKSQLSLVDSSGRASLGSQISSNDASMHNAKTNTNYMNNSGQQPSLSKQKREYSQTESQISQEGRRWLDSNQQKPYVEEKRVVENSTLSRDSLRTDTAFWSHQQNAFLHNNNAQQTNRPSPSNFVGYVPENGGLVSANQDNLLDKDRNMQMSRELVRGAAARHEPVSNSNVSIGGSFASSKDETVAPGFSNMKGNHESGQKPPNNQHLDLWKSVKYSGKPGFDGSGRDQQNLNMGPPVLEASDNNPDVGAAETHETENGDRQDGSNDSHRSSFPHNASAGGSRENMWSDAADRRSFPGANDKSSGQGGKKGSVSRKFQYHPMGDLDMDSDSYAAKQVLHSQPLSQHLSSGIKSQEANPRFLGQLSTNTTEMEKGRVSNFRGPVNASGGVHPGYLPSTSTPIVRPGETFSPNQHMSPRQNMLELLHKVDQSKEQTTASHPSTIDYNRVSDIPVAGPAAPSQNQFSTSHGFSLQLAPPSQGIAPSNHIDAAQSSTKAVGSPSSSYVACEKGDKTHAWLPHVSSAQRLPPSRQPNQMESANESDRLGNRDADVSVPNMKGNFSAPLPTSYLKNTLQNQHLIAPGGKGTSDQSTSMSPNRHAYHDQQLNNSQPQATTSHSVSNSQDTSVSARDLNQSGMRGLVHQMPASFRAAIAGMSRKDTLSPLGSNLLTSQQQLLGAQGYISPDLIKSQFQSHDSPETSFPPQKKDEQDGAKRVDALSSQGIAVREESQVVEGRSTMKASGGSQEEEASVRHLSGASPSNSAVSQKDIEAFHHSVKPNSSTHNSYSLLHQMQAMKSMGTDPSHRESKRLKGQEYGLDPQHMVGQAAESVSGSMDNTVRDSPMSQTSVSAVDAKMLTFSPQLGNRNPSFQLPHGTVTSQDMLSFGRSDPQRFAAGNLTSRNEHTGISPQMAPSWFEQYGTFKNGQLLPVHNVPRMPMMKSVEQQFSSGKSPSNSVQLTTAVAETGQIANTCQTANAYTPNEQVSSLHALVPHVPVSSSASMRPKKRKTATSDLLPWYKEIGQSLKKLQNMSSAEVAWAQSSNRLIEKIENEMDISEDLLPMIRPKRRLLLTTQLIQQVFQPPSAAVLSLDASSNYEVIVYSLARSVLGEACSLVSGVESSSPVESGKSLSGKGKSSEKIRDQYFSKVVEEYVTRTEVLEDDLLRLDKRASILDFRLECQDLERFSVINRFARFHGRGQAEGAETSSSSDATAAGQKQCPQRYVSAHPMPKNVPERVQCLSL